MQVYGRARAILESLQSLAYGHWQAMKKEAKTVFVNSETHEEFEKCPLLYESIVEKFKAATPRYRRRDLCAVYQASTTSSPTGLLLDSSTVIIDLVGKTQKFQLRTIVLEALIIMETENITLGATSSSFLQEAMGTTIGPPTHVEEVLEAELMDEAFQSKKVTLLSTLLEQMRVKTGAPLGCGISIATPRPAGKGAEVQATKVLRHAAHVAGWHLVASPSTMEALGASLALKWPFDEMMELDKQCYRESGMSSSGGGNRGSPNGIGGIGGGSGGGGIGGGGDGGIGGTANMSIMGGRSGGDMGSPRGIGGFGGGIGGGGIGGGGIGGGMDSSIHGTADIGRFVEEAFDDMELELHARHVSEGSGGKFSSDGGGLVGLVSIGSTCFDNGCTNGAIDASAPVAKAADACKTVHIVVVNMGIKSTQASLIGLTPPITPNSIGALGIDATYEVKTQASHALLGVRSYTDLLFGHFATKLLEDHSVSVGHAGTPDGRRLADALTRLCKLLSTQSEAKVLLEKFIDKKQDVVFELSRSELRRICASPFTVLRSLLEEIIKPTSEIDQIELTGPGNEMPMMIDVLQEVLKCTTPLLKTSNFDISIAMGASILGQTLAPFEHALSDRTRWGPSIHTSTIPWGRTHMLRSDAGVHPRAGGHEADLRAAEVDAIHDSDGFDDNSDGKGGGSDAAAMPNPAGDHEPAGYLQAADVELRDVEAIRDGDGFLLNFLVDDIFEGGGTMNPAGDEEPAGDERMSVGGAHEPPSGRLRPRKPITYFESRHDPSSSRSDTSSHPPLPSDSASEYAPSECGSSTKDSSECPTSSSSISQLAEAEVIEQNPVWADKADRRTIHGKTVHVPLCITEDDEQLAVQEIRAHVLHEAKCGDNKLQHFLTLLFKKLHNNSKWLQPAPQASVFSFAADPTDARVVDVQRRIARRFGFLAPSVARNFTFYSWPEAEHRVLSELARGGWLYEATKADRELIYGAHDSLDALLDTWRGMLHAAAAKTQKTYAADDDAILEDFELGRAASAGAMREPLTILARDWDTLKKNNVLSVRLGINVLPGGRQAREGGNSKNATSADVNGPTHFCLEDAETGRLLDKEDELDSYRCRHVHDSKVDPIRRPVARELKANKSEHTAAYRHAAIQANTFSALVESILAGRSQAAMIPQIFALDPPWKQGDARRWMTSESACFGEGDLPERWAAPAYLAHKNYPPNFITAVEQHESLTEWPMFPTTDDDVCDGDEVCKPFPTEADLAGATGGPFGALLKAFEASTKAGEVRPLQPRRPRPLHATPLLAATFALPPPQLTSHPSLAALVR